MSEGLTTKRFMHVRGRRETTFTGTAMHFDASTRLISIYVDNLVVVYINLAPGESVHEMTEGDK